jgi:hypothetical protein
MKNICPKCGSDNIQQTGPMAKLKIGCEPTDYNQQNKTFCCCDCEHKWELPAIK